MFKHSNTTQIVKAKCTSKFAIIPNALLQDKNLKIEDKGLLCWLLSMSDGWVIYQTKLQDYHANGKSALDASFKRLIKLGYIVHEQKRIKGKMAGSNYIVYSEPQIVKQVKSISFSENQVTEIPVTESPLSENPKSVDQPLISNNSISNNIKRNNTHTQGGSSSKSWSDREWIINTIIKLKPSFGLDGAGAEADEFINYNQLKNGLSRTLTENLIRKWVSNSSKDKGQPQSIFYTQPYHQPSRKLRAI